MALLLGEEERKAAREFPAAHVAEYWDFGLVRIVVLGKNDCLIEEEEEKEYAVDSCLHSFLGHCGDE